MRVVQLTDGKSSSIDGFALLEHDVHSLTNAKSRTRVKFGTGVDESCRSNLVAGWQLSNGTHGVNDVLGGLSEMDTRRCSQERRDIWQEKSA